MRSLCAVVAVLAAAVVSSTVAVAPCDPNIVEQLRTTKECYKDGKPPKLTASGVMGTHVRISANMLPPTTHCVTAVGRPGSADVILYGKDNKKIYGYTVKQTPQNDHLLESDSEGNTFKLYVIHNEANVYSYYRCIAGGNAKSDGTPMGDVAVGCANVNDVASEAIIKRAEICFKKIGIHNIISLAACDPTLCK